MEQKTYTLKECRAFNQKSLELTTKFAKGNLKNGECKELTLPDEAHPWNILHSVIDQFYKREYGRAQLIDIARCELKEAKELLGEIKEQNNLYWKMQKEISDLKHENEQLKETLSHTDKSSQKQPKALQELMLQDAANGWAERLDDMQDDLITALEYGADGKRISGGLFTARTLQKFFIELAREIN